MPVLSILILDDDAQFGRLISRVVSGMGHLVEQIVSPREIMDRYDTFAPDVIFLDIFMPDFDGIEVAKWLSDKGFRGKLVFMTGHDPAFLTAARTAIEANIDATLATLEKPARVETIRALLTDSHMPSEEPVRVEQEQGVENERRACPRKKTLKAATIVYHYDSCTMKCIILDMSETGARLKPAESTGLPETFRLVISHGPTYQCKVVRREEDQIGVRFE